MSELRKKNAESIKDLYDKQENEIDSLRKQCIEIIDNQEVITKKHKEKIQMLEEKSEERISQWTKSISAIQKTIEKEKKTLKKSIKKLKKEHAEVLKSLQFSTTQPTMV